MADLYPMCAAGLLDSGALRCPVLRIQARPSRPPAVSQAQPLGALSAGAHLKGPGSPSPHPARLLPDHSCGQAAAAVSGQHTGGQAWGCLGGGGADPGLVQSGSAFGC